MLKRVLTLCIYSGSSHDREMQVKYLLCLSEGNEVTFAAHLFPAHRLEKGLPFSPPIKQMLLKSCFPQINDKASVIRHED